MPFAFRTQWICESLFIVRIIDRIINYEISISGNDRTQIAVKLSLSLDNFKRKL